MRDETTNYEVSHYEISRVTSFRTRHHFFCLKTETSTTRILFFSPFRSLNFAPIRESLYFSWACEEQFKE